MADSASTYAELAIEGDLAQLISLKKALKNHKIEKEKNPNKHLKLAQTFYISRYTQKTKYRNLAIIIITVVLPTPL